MIKIAEMVRSRISFRIRFGSGFRSVMTSIWWDLGIVELLREPVFLIRLVSLRTGLVRDRKPLRPVTDV